MKRTVLADIDAIGDVITDDELDKVHGGRRCGTRFVIVWILPDNEEYTYHDD